MGRVRFVDRADFIDALSSSISVIGVRRLRVLRTLLAIDDVSDTSSSSLVAVFLVRFDGAAFALVGFPPFVSGSVGDSGCGVIILRRLRVDGVVLLDSRSTDWRRLLGVDDTESASEPARERRLRRGVFGTCCSSLAF